jgi:hypothetical protein
VVAVAVLVSWPPQQAYPNSRSFAIAMMDVCRFKNGKVIERWGVPNRYHQLAQLGLLSPPAQPAEATAHKMSNI